MYFMVDVCYSAHGFGMKSFINFPFKVKDCHIQFKTEHYVILFLTLAVFFNVPFTKDLVISCKYNVSTQMIKSLMAMTSIYLRQK